jgi:transcriptional regulator GlxA family with amidase domain
MEKIEIVLFDGFDELDALGPFEVLSNARFDVRLVTYDESVTVLGSHGAMLVPHGALSEDADLVLVPGGGWNDRSEHGARAEVERGDLPRRLAALHAADTPLAAVCTGGMLLAAAGVLEGRAATTHHGALDDLRASGADVVDARVVDDGDVLTCGGVTSGLDLALWLVERERGPRIADAVAREMEHERRGSVHAPAGSGGSRRG